MASESNYLDIIDRNRSGGVEHAATTPVFYERPAKRRLTKNRARAKLLKSASDKTRAAKSGERKTTSRTRKKPPMASKKQKAAARRNIKKAQAAKRAKAASRSRAAKKAARTRKAKHSHKAARKATKRTARKARKSSKRSRAAKKAARTRKANKAARSKAARKGRKSRKSHKSSRKARRSSKRRSSRRARRSTSLKLPRKARKVYLVAAEKRRHRRHGGGRRRGAMENPMTGVEIFVGSITGLAGFGLADFVDRMLATHALTDKNAKDANGQELYADNPPADGNYVGLFNPTAICAPMDWKRWVFGLLGAAVPLGAAQLVSGPTARSALQFFGFGYGVRVVGKGLIDGLAALTTSTGMGQRLYDGEMRAAVLKANNGNNQANALASLPAAGLGQPKALAGAPCKDCGDKQQTGAGYPSMPREVASQTQPQPTSATPPAPPPAPATPPSAFNPGPLTGTPSNGAPKKRSPYAWGESLS